MSVHNICFYEVIRKLSPNIPPKSTARIFYSDLCSFLIKPVFWNLLIRMFFSSAVCSQYKTFPE